MLMDADNVDVAEDSTKVAQMIESVFTDQCLKVFKGNSTTVREQPAHCSYSRFPCHRDARVFEGDIHQLRGDLGCEAQASGVDGSRTGTRTPIERYN